MQFIEITNGKKSKKVSVPTFEREQEKRYKGWTTGAVTGVPSAVQLKSPAPNIQKREFLPPEVQQLRSQTDPAGEVGDPQTLTGPSSNGLLPSADAVAEPQAAGVEEKKVIRRGAAKKSA